MTELAEDERLIECVKANYGRSGWGARLRARHSPAGRLLEFELADRMERPAIEAARQEIRERGRNGNGARKVDPTKASGAGKAPEPIL